MRELVLLGGGTAGTMIANKLLRRLAPGVWRITVVDRDDDHHYQPGYLRVPFGDYDPEAVVRSRHAQLADGIRLITGEVDLVRPERNQVLFKDGRVLPYDQLVIATGTTPRPSETPGMVGKLWRESIFDFYTLEGAVALRSALARFRRGRLVVHITDMPIKCPVAPLEFTFLVEAWLRKRGLREAVDIVYVTPLSGAFTKPVASRLLGRMLDERRIGLESDFMVECVDEENKTLDSYDGRDVPFDLLVTVPLNMGADFVSRSGLGDELNYVPVDPGTLLSAKHRNVFAVGDANDIPTSKAGSVAHSPSRSSATTSSSTSRDFL